MRVNERISHNRLGLYSEIWIDLYSEYDFFLNFRMKRLTFYYLFEAIMQQQGIQKVSK